MVNKMVKAYLMQAIHINPGVKDMALLQDQI